MNDAKVNAPNNYSLVTDIGSVTTFFLTLLWVSIALSVVALFSNIMQLNLLSDWPYPQAAGEANDSRQQTIGLLQVALILGTRVAYLVWINRANKNCHGFGAQGMQFTSGWAVAYFFIPIVNLFRPYQVMKEVWKVSANPSGWQSQTVPGVLGLWWALWIATVFVDQIVMQMGIGMSRPGAVTLGALRALTGWSIVSEVLYIVLCFVLIHVISRVRDMQFRLASNASRVEVPKSVSPAPANPRSVGMRPTAIRTPAVAVPERAPSAPVSKVSDFGFTVDNPVLMSSLPECYAYIAALRTKSGSTVSIGMRSSTHSARFPHPVDRYELNYADGRPLGTIFMYGYNDVSVDLAPEGYVLDIGAKRTAAEILRRRMGGL